jgi:hypothetical protein
MVVVVVVVIVLTTPLSPLSVIISIALDGTQQ